MQQSGTNCTGSLAQLRRLQHWVNPVAWRVQQGGKAFLNARQKDVGIFHDAPTNYNGVGVGHVGDIGKPERNPCTEFIKYSKCINVTRPRANDYFLA
jgi:hypothetical protein